eukprot:jgi/Mesvir1/14220/Mv09670-RA.1
MTKMGFCACFRPATPTVYKSPKGKANAAATDPPPVASRSIPAPAETQKVANEPVENVVEVPSDAPPVAVGPAPATSDEKKGDSQVPTEGTAIPAEDAELGIEKELEEKLETANKELEGEDMAVSGFKASFTDDQGIRLDFKGTERLMDTVIEEEDYEEEELDVPVDITIPKLNIVIMIVGTRGDVQPFIAMGQKLVSDYGHRVRLASHRVYREFVTENGLEFYPLGGDPQVLSEYMTRNQGIMASRLDDVTTSRRMITEITHSCWDACISADTESGGAPFLADAIIANPPAYGHIHCAEKLCIPLHMYFTMPWSPTRMYPHALARISDMKINDYRNRLSYFGVDQLIWAGIMDIINNFRMKLQLEPIRVGVGSASFLHRCRVPFCYIWSPALAPAPTDWGKHIDVVGFYFLEGISKAYTPPQDLANFLAAGPPPIYIGFGSLVVPNPEKLTQIIYNAVRKTGVRALVSKGWGGLGEGPNKPDDVFVLGNCPHDWLFPHCSAVIHHGGAGTTAAGAKAGKPTTVVPFFGDQPFWGLMIHRQGAGPPAIPINKFNEDTLVAAIEYMQQDSVKAAAKDLATRMNRETGVANGCAAFHKHLPLKSMICDTCKGRVARKWVKEQDIKVCLTCCEILFPSTEAKTVTLRNYRFIGWEPAAGDRSQDSAGVVRGAVSGAGGFLHETVTGLTGIIMEPMRGYKSEGTKGAAKGLGKGLIGVIARPMRGGVILLEQLSEGLDRTVKSRTPEQREEYLRRKAERESLATSTAPTEGTSSVSTGAPAEGSEGGDKPAKKKTKKKKAEKRVHSAGKKKIGHVGTGLVEGGKKLLTGIKTGGQDLVRLPARGYKEKGALGAAKGVARGSISVVTKPLAGILGLVATVGQGVINTPGAVIDKVTHKKDKLELLLEPEYERAKVDAQDVALRERVMREYRSLVHARELQEVAANLAAEDREACTDMGMSVRGFHAEFSEEDHGIKMAFVRANGEEDEEDDDDAIIEEADQDEEEEQGDELALPAGCHVPKLNVVMLVVGTASDVQPFLAMGRKLAAEYGHRVRVATHHEYRSLVSESGLEFYPLEGDPKVLSEFMTRNQGITASKKEDVRASHKVVTEIIHSCWDACVRADAESGGRSFVADTIIANPPAYGHIHCAEKLCIPLHMYFTMPWSPTRMYPHPLARMSRTKPGDYRNRLSYFSVDSIMWAELKDIINNFRIKLQLEPIRVGSGGASFLHKLRTPFCYTWSPALAPAPTDWKHHIDVVGFLEPISKAYTPPEDLANFLAAGPPPIYIGFGSLVVPNPEKLTQIIFGAVRKTGVRAILSKGASGLGDGPNKPDEIFLLDKHCPHDWLFPQCSGVIHHGGVGTTAAGAKAGKPTTIIPSFGDQFFWGDKIHTQGAGPFPIPMKRVTEPVLVDAITFMQHETVKAAAKDLATRMSKENGVQGGCEALHKHLPLASMVCDTCKERVARLWVDALGVKMCYVCNEIINLRECKAENAELRVSPYRYISWNLAEGNADNDDGPAAGAGGMLHEREGGIAGTIMQPIQGFKRGGTAVKKGFAGAVIRPVKKGVVLLDTLVSEMTGDAKQKEKPSNVITGVKAGTEGLGRSVKSGVTGLVTKPMEGYKEKGAKGLATGILTGTTGVVVKPIGGLLGLVAKSGEGMLNTPAAIKSSLEKARAAKKEKKRAAGVVKPDNDDESRYRVTLMSEDLLAEIAEEASNAQLVARVMANYRELCADKSKAQLESTAEEPKA